jgi:hypothetical protein
MNTFCLPGTSHLFHWIFANALQRRQYFAHFMNRKTMFKKMKKLALNLLTMKSQDERSGVTTMPYQYVMLSVCM